MSKYKFVLVVVSFLFASFCKADGVYTYGETIDFQSGFIGSFWHPAFQLSKYDSTDGEEEHLNLLTVYLKTIDTYHKFPEESKMLLKFSNDSIAELNSFGSVTKNYSTQFIGNIWQSVYLTGRSYIIPDEVLTLLLSLPITKVRIELDNGNRQDYEINEGLGKKIRKKMIKSFKGIRLWQKERIKNKTGDLKDDF